MKKTKFDHKFKHSPLSYGGVFFAACLLAACQPQQPKLYYWGSYESILYDEFNKPGKADAQTQIFKLEEDIQKANAKGSKSPPGVHAQLGAAYLSLGQEDAALNAFHQETSLYPESQAWVENLTASLKKANTPSASNKISTD